MPRLMPAMAAAGRSISLFAEVRPSRHNRGIKSYSAIRAAFCRSMPAGDSRSQCWEGVGLQIGGFFSNLTSRQRACGSENLQDSAACERGAGVASAGKGTITSRVRS